MAQEVVDFFGALIGVGQAQFLLLLTCGEHHPLLAIRHEFVPGDWPVPVDVAAISRGVSGKGHSSYKPSSERGTPFLVTSKMS